MSSERPATRKAAKDASHAAAAALRADDQASDEDISFVATNPPSTAASSEMGDGVNGKCFPRLGFLVISSYSYQIAYYYPMMTTWPSPPRRPTRNWVG